ncbi:MAG: serine/threonine protein phosphatase [Ruminococcaceae bacterium]|nr:serine/threonine protein phosphatase [Oscillospiraceae bacterium]
MALYAIGDLHLSLGTNKSMEVFKGRWTGYVEKIKSGFSKLRDDDICVLCGDISWGMSLDESKNDFLFIDALPGKKIIIKGNHDYWWNTRTKIGNFFDEIGVSSIEILNNNSFDYNEEFAICGTRGWFYEEEKGTLQDAKVLNRELMRLKASLDSAGDKEKLVFLHYPPKFLNYTCSEMISIISDYNARLCCYGHIHDKGCQVAFEGKLNGTEYKLVSADHLNFVPHKIFD